MTTCFSMARTLLLTFAMSCVTAAEPAASPKVVKLERQSVILPKTAVRAGKRKNFYTAKISVGSPAQEFHMTFDLGGGTMVLPSQKCTDPSCLERRRFDKWVSESAEDINANGQLVEAKKAKTLLRKRDRGTLGLHSIDIGSGQVKGTFVRDQVCVTGEADDNESENEPRCFPLAMLVASKMTDMPFLLEPYDGVIGIGLKGMSVSSEFNFLSSFHRGYGDGHGGVFSNSFGLHLGAGDDGAEITFGGYDSKRLTHPLQWTTVVAPEEGRWQVSISAIRVGNSTIDACRDGACRAAIDYSASLLGVPTKLAGSLENALARLAPRSGFGDGCQTLAIPDLHLDLKDGVTITLPAEDFVSDFGAQSNLISKASCNPLLTHVDSDENFGPDMFVLGESALRRYYTFFNADTLSVGFSLAAGALDKSGKLLPALDDGKSAGKKALDKNPVILLVQLKFLRSKAL